MKQDKFSKPGILLYVLGIIPVTWLGLLIAPSLSEGITGLIRDFASLLDHPFHIVLCEDSLRTALISLLLYAMAIAVFLSSERNYRRREEHGSAKWGDPFRLGKKYADAKNN